MNRNGGSTWSGIYTNDTLSFGGMTYAETQKFLKEGWRNCFISIMNLSQATDNYMMYYRRRHLDAHIKKPSPEFYKLILEQMNKVKVKSGK